VLHKGYAGAGNIPYDSGLMIVDFERAELCSRNLSDVCEGKCMFGSRARGPNRLLIRE